MTTVFGVDPGTYGAMAEVTANGIYVLRFIRKTHLQIISEFEQRVRMARLNGGVYGFKENKGPRSGERVDAVFTNGRNHGFAEALFEFNRIPYAKIDSSPWQLEFNLGGKFATDSQRKNAHRAKAQDVFQREFTLDEADAALIAGYGWRKVHDNLTGGKDGRERIMPEVQRTEDGRRIWNIARERQR